MAMSDLEKEQFKRARIRVDESHIDDMSRESTYNALSASEAMLVNPSLELVATAVSKLTLAFAHNASGAPKAAARAIEKAIDAHEDKCRDMHTGTTTVTTTIPTPVTKMTMLEFIDRRAILIFWFAVAVLIAAAVNSGVKDIVADSATTALDQHEQRSRQ